MDIEQIRSYCLSKKAVKEELPFGPDVLVFKVMNKIFALLPIDSPDSINLKADPVQALEWRSRYEEVVPGYHMNKKHWNTVHTRGQLPQKLICEMIDHSYAQVINNLSKKEKSEWQNTPPHPDISD